MRLSRRRGEIYRWRCESFAALARVATVGQGWYRQSPERTRAIAYGVAVLVLIGAVAVTVLLGAFTQAALIGLGLVAGAVALLVVAGKFPARPGKGSAFNNRRIFC